MAPIHGPIGVGGDGSGGGVGALVLGPEPNMFVATSNRDAAETGQIVSRTSVGTWTLSGARPGSGQLQFNESLREVAISHRDSSGNDVSATVGVPNNSPLVDRTFRLQIDTNNRVDFTITNARITGTQGGITYTVFDTSVFTNEVGVVSINNTAMLIPRELSGGPDWLAEYDANADYAILVTGPDPDDAYVRRDGKWVEVIASLLRGQQGMQGIQGNPGVSDGVADSIDLSISGNQITATVGRTNALADLTDSATLPQTDAGPALGPEVFKAQLSDVAVTTTPQTLIEVLDIAAADVEFNTGTFTVEAQATPTGRDKIVLPMFSGTRYYRVIANMAAIISAGTSTRSLLEGRVSIERGGAVMVQDVTAREYNRGLTGTSADAVNTSAMSFSTIIEVQSGDKIGFQLRNINNFAFSVQGDQSTFEVERLQGSGNKGDKGDPGAGNPLKGAWVANTSYDRGDIVTHDDTLWILYGAATHSSASAPPASPLQWFRLGRVQDRQSASNYRAGDIVIGSDDRLYICITDGANIATNPVTTSANWHLFNPVRQGLQWNTTIAYARGDVVFQTDKMYMCQVATSTGTNPTTASQTDWVEVGGGSGGSATTGMARGALVATGSWADTTGTQNLNTNIPGVSWTKASGIGDYVVVTNFALDFRAGAYPDDVIGMWFVPVTGTGSSRVEHDRVFHPLNGHIAAEEEVARFRAAGTSHAIVIREQSANVAATNPRPTRYTLRGAGTDLPASSSIEVYWAVVRGGKGDPGTSEPVYFYWANGATDRVTDGFPYTQNAGTDSRLRFQFAQDNPNERVHVTTGPASWFVAGSSVANLDSGGAPAASTDRVVFQPPAGTWKLKLYAGQDDDGSVSTSGIGLFEINASTDDTVIVESLGADRSPGLFGFSQRNIVVVDSDEITTNGTRQFYWMALTKAEDAAREADWSFYMRAEKVA